MDDDPTILDHVLAWLPLNNPGRRRAVPAHHAGITLL